MRKLLLIICLCTLCSVACASENENQGAHKAEIGMALQEPSKEADKNKWSIILKNDLAIYLYDNTAINFLPNKKGNNDINLIETDIKAIFINKETLKPIDAKYNKELKNGDTTAYCLIHMIFNRADKTFKTTAMQVFSKKGIKIEDKKVIAPFSPIPEKSFAEAMLEVVNKYAEDNRGEAAFTKRYLVI